MRTRILVRLFREWKTTSRNKKYSINVYLQLQICDIIMCDIIICDIIINEQHVRTTAVTAHVSWSHFQDSET